MICCSIEAFLENPAMLKGLEKDIGSFLLKQPQITSIEKAIDLLSDRFHNVFPIEFSNADKTVFYVVIIYRFEEGVYDNGNDL